MTAVGGHFGNPGIWGKVTVRKNLPGWFVEPNFMSAWKGKSWKQSIKGAGKNEE